MIAPKALAAPLVCALAMLWAPAAYGSGTTLSVSTSGPVRGVQVQATSAPGLVMDLRVSGGTDGALTLHDPGGLSLSTVSGAPCATVSATTAACGVPGDPVTYLMVTGGALADTVDLSALALQASSAPGFPPASPFDADRRMRGIFATVDTGAGPDRIVGGGAGAAYIPGEGDDTVIGGAGDELVRADATSDGDDAIEGGPGYDTMSYALRTESVTAVLADTPTTGNGATGTTESDSLSGIEGLSGGHGGDRLSITGTLGGLGTLLGYEGDDLLHGGPSTDRLEGGPGADDLHGGSGDDRLLDGRALGEAQGHLDGGAGDDELVQNDARGPGWSLPDGTPTCGPGTDVLRADAGFDDGVGLTAGPVDCEVLATAGSGSGSGATIAGDVRVGSTLTVVPNPGLTGTPIAGRVSQTIWRLCSGVAGCEDRVVAGFSLTLGPDDLGRELEYVTVPIAEPLSQAGRWVEERPALRLRSPQLEAFSGRLVLPALVVATPTPKPTPMPAAAPDPKPVARAVARAFGRRPKVAALRRTTTVRLAAATGTRVDVRLTARRSSRRVVVARGSALARRGRVVLRLRPTAAGKALARRGRAASVQVTTTLVSAQGAVGTAATQALKLRGAR